ncbi:MAG: hypothetical protein HQM10_09340 [Candidatus Riflebacteria bacterium]|nr:hypothetical protein [Candidatus Riflebacteria bacterium]
MKIIIIWQLNTSVRRSVLLLFFFWIMVSVVLAQNTTSDIEPTAADGQTLSGQSRETISSFLSSYGDMAAQRWVEEHNREIGQGAQKPPSNRIKGHIPSSNRAAAPRGVTAGDVASASNVNNPATIKSPQSGEVSAADGQSLSEQPKEVMELFLKTYGDQAAQKWAEEHNISIGQPAGNVIKPGSDSPPQNSFPVPETPAPVSNTVVNGGFWSISPTDNATTGDIEHLKELGVKTVRLNLERGRSLDSAISAYNNAGIQVMILVCYDAYDANPIARPSDADERVWPKWEGYHYDRDKVLEMVDLLKVVIPHYSKMGVRCWEIWNEQNAGWKMDPNVYAELLGTVYEKCKLTEKWDPNAFIVFGGLDATITGSEWNAGTKAYLDAFYKSPHYKWFKAKYKRSPFDAMAFHPYGSDTAQKLIKSVNNVCLAPMKANGDGSLPIWLTEIGDSSRDDEEQARKIELLCRTAFSIPSIKRFFLFKYYYGGDDPNSWFSISRDGKKRTGFYRYKQMIQQLGDR